VPHVSLAERGGDGLPVDIASVASGSHTYGYRILISAVKTVWKPAMSAEPSDSRGSPMVT